MQFRFSSIAILSLFVAGLLLVARRTCGNRYRHNQLCYRHGRRRALGNGDLYGQRPRPTGFIFMTRATAGPGMNQGKPAAGFAAGGHYDPGHTKKHLGPLSTAGHRGDLPLLVVDSRGDATEAVTAPHSI
jgi:hypothetical protein